MAVNAPNSSVLSASTDDIIEKRHGKSNVFSLIWLGLVWYDFYLMKKKVWIQIMEEDEDDDNICYGRCDLYKVAWHI